MTGKDPERLQDIDRRYFWVILGLLLPFTILGYFNL
jgi:hypothetical protein